MALGDDVPVQPEDAAFESQMQAMLRQWPLSRYQIEQLRAENARLQGELNKVTSALLALQAANTIGSSRWPAASGGASASGAAEHAAADAPEIPDYDSWSNIRTTAICVTNICA